MSVIATYLERWVKLCGVMTATGSPPARTTAAPWAYVVWDAGAAPALPSKHSGALKIAARWVATTASEETYSSWEESTAVRLTG